MHDVIVVGGGFAGVTAAREAALRGCSVLLLEARDRLGGRTHTTSWDGIRIEEGGAWVHWHQPHTWSELTRAGLAVELSPDADEASWFVGDERRTGSVADRNAITERGWNRFVEGAAEALPQPYDPLLAIDAFDAFDRLTIAERLDQLDLGAEERDVLQAEVESVAHGPIDEAGAASIVRWHVLSGGSLALAQYAGGRVTIADGTVALLDAIAAEAPVERRLETPVAAVRRCGDGSVEVETRAGALHAARAVVVAVPLNVLGRIRFEPALSEAKQAGIALGQASRGIKIFVRAEPSERASSTLRPGHPFGHLSVDSRLDDGSELLIGFGADAHAVDPSDRDDVQRALQSIVPGAVAIAATAHDWLADEFARGTWAIHRPGWYRHHHAAMSEPEGAVLLAGSDLANGWAGFIDGAIESGLRAGRRAAARARS
jgi:monoamine oxidase